MQPRTNASFLKLGIGTVFAIAILALVTKLTDVAIPDFSRVNWAAAALAVLLSMLTVAIRAANYRAAVDSRNHAGALAWMRLSGRHQFLFTAFPSGMGDLTFPVLANTQTDLDVLEATRVILVTRIRDICVLAGLALMSAVIIGLLPTFAILGLVALVPVALFADVPADRIFRAARSRLTVNSIVEQEDAKSVQPTRQLFRLALSTASWLSAAAAAMASFTAAGWYPDIWQALLIIATLNASGLVAISLGGIGVAEVSAIAALLLLGHSQSEAGQIALIGRPVLLSSMLLASAVLSILPGRQRVEQQA